MKLVKFITGPAVHRVVEFFKYLSKQGDGKKQRMLYGEEENKGR
jgi:hypothetical protein